MRNQRLAALAIAIALAAPAAADDAVESFLQEADMTFTLEQADGLSRYDVTTPGGRTFGLSKREDGYTFTLEETREPILPLNGDWSRTIEPTRVDCGSEEQAAFVILQLRRFEQILNAMIGSNDGGATAQYEFTAPFRADQLLDPSLEVLQMAEVFSETRYDVGGNNLHTAQGRFTQPSDFDIDFKAEIAVISEHLLIGYWHGAAESDTAADPCRAEGFITWYRQQG